MVSSSDFFYRAAGLMVIMSFVHMITNPVAQPSVVTAINGVTTAVLLGTAAILKALGK